MCCNIGVQVGTLAIRRPAPSAFAESRDNLNIMRITIAHTRTQQQMIDIVDRAFEDVFRGLPLGPIEITNQHKVWQGSVMNFSLTAKIGFLKNPVSGTVQVNDRDIILTADLGMLNKLISAEKIQNALETRLRGLLT
jgi:hypothetical protein